MENQINQSFYDEGLIPGRMLSWSKSGYREKFPENEVYFNANIFLLGEGKVWYGDLDVTRDFSILQKIASSLGKSIYILRELDGRLDKEDLSDSEILKFSVKTINP
jgi:hypothetical protein